ncbi:MAG: peptidyl-prolyl cis-trans isomerase [Chitinispirillaceae bacterium]|nr:peptidyl-prolyl cis-trans isomerase [Chitinispirillaceae bacterium]
MTPSDRYSFYQDWVINDVSIFSNKAQEDGIVINNNEFEKKAKEFTAMFPGLPLVEHNIKDEILAVKYLERTFGSRYVQDEIIKEFKTFQKFYGDDAGLTIKDVDHYLKLKSLMSRKDIKEYLSKIKFTIQKEQYAKELKNKEPWNTEDLKIFPESNEWLISSKDQSDCYITVKDFNRQLKFCKIPKKISKDSAIGYALHKIAADRFFSNEAVKSGFTDSLNANKEIKTKLLSAHLYKSTYNFGKPVTDVSILWQTYGQYYDQLFKEKKEVGISVIGSTNREIIDSMHTELLKAKNNNQLVSDSTIPWTTLNLRKLPIPLKYAGDTLKYKQISDVITTAYGYFILRCDTIYMINEKPFEEVRLELIHLATRQKWGNLDSVLECEADKIITNNRWFNTPIDTFEIDVNMNTPKTYGERQVKTAFLSRNSTLLPFDIQLSLCQLMHDKKTIADKKIIKINNDLGDWLIAVKKIKKGKGIIRSNVYRNQIKDSLIVNEMGPAYSPFMSDTVILHNAYMQMNRKHYFKRTVVTAGAYRKTIPISDAEQKTPESFSRREKFDKNEERFEKFKTWMESLKVNTRIITLASKEIMCDFNYQINQN